MNVFEKIDAQQAKVKKRSPQWMVGEQLKDICRREPNCAQIISQDLDRATMSIVEAEKKLKAFADKNRTGNFSCVTPAEADRILREFYGLPAQADSAAEEKNRSKQNSTGVINLFDFV